MECLRPRWRPLQSNGLLLAEEAGEDSLEGCSDLAGAEWNSTRIGEDELEFAAGGEGDLDLGLDLGLDLRGCHRLGSVWRERT